MGRAEALRATAPAARLAFTLQVPADWKARFPKQAVAVAVTLNGRRMGQIAEAVLEFRPYGVAASGGKALS